MGNVFKKIGNGVLAALNGFFCAFSILFQGISWLLKKLWQGISFVFVGIGRGVHFFLVKCIKPIFVGIGNFFKLVLCKIERLFNRIFRSKKSSDSTYEKEGSEKKSVISSFLSTKITYRKRQALWGYLFITPLIIGFVYFFLFPFITTIVFSFSNIYRAGVIKDTGEVMGVVTEWVGFDNYDYIMNVHSTFKDTLGSVFLDSLLNVVMILIFSLIIAVVLNSKFKGRSFVRAVFFMPVIFNSQAVDTATKIAGSINEMLEGEQDIFSTMFNFADFLTNANVPAFAVNFLTGASDSIFDVISYSGVQILIFLSGIQSVPKHLYEAAKIEGATQYEIFWKITFPMVSPLMLTAGVYTVVDSFMRSELLTIMDKFALAGDTTYTLGLGNLTNDGVYAAMSILFCLVSAVVVMIVLLAIRKTVFYYDE